MQNALPSSSTVSPDSLSRHPVQGSPGATAKRKSLDVSVTGSVDDKSMEGQPGQPANTTLNENMFYNAPAEKSKQINFFSGHELKTTHDGPQALNRNSPDWIFPLLLLILAAFAWLKTYYYKYFVQIMSAFWNNNLTNQIVRDESILVQRASMVLNILFNLVAALFLYFVSIHYAWPLGGIGTGINRYLFFTLIVTATYAVKFLILKVCGYLFNTSREMATYLFNIFLINNMLCLLLIPLVSLYAFSNLFSSSRIIEFSIILVGVAYLYRIIRGLAIGFTSVFFSPYYLFLYLCTLEFAPLLLLVKILSQK